MKHILIPATAVLISFAGFAFAEGDAEKGEKDFKKCKACHTVASADEVIIKGGRTGPNLYGVVGRQAGTAEGFKFGSSMIQAGEGGLVWTEELLVAYVADPKGFLKEVTGDSGAKSKMSFKLKSADDVAAFLATTSEDIAQKNLVSFPAASYCVTTKC